MTLLSGNTQVFDGSPVSSPVTNEVIFNNPIRVVKLDYRTDAITLLEMNLTVTANYTFTTPVNGLALPSSQQVISPVSGGNRIVTLVYSDPVTKLTFDATSSSSKKLYLTILEMNNT